MWFVGFINRPMPTRTSSGLRLHEDRSLGLLSPWPRPSPARRTMAPILSGQFSTTAIAHEERERERDDTRHLHKTQQNARQRGRGKGRLHLVSATLSIGGVVIDHEKRKTIDSLLEPSWRTGHSVKQATSYPDELWVSPSETAA